MVCFWVRLMMHVIFENLKQDLYWEAPEKVHHQSQSPTNHWLISLYRVIWIALCQQRTGAPPFISFQCHFCVAVGSNIAFVHSTQRLGKLLDCWSMLVLYVFISKTHDKFTDMSLTHVWCRILPVELQNDQVPECSLCWKHRNLSPSSPSHAGDGAGVER